MHWVGAVSSSLHWSGDVAIAAQLTQGTQWHLTTRKTLDAWSSSRSALHDADLVGPAGALPADVAAKAGHELVAGQLRAAAAGDPPELERSHWEALIKSFADEPASSPQSSTSSKGMKEDPGQPAAGGDMPAAALAGASNGPLHTPAGSRAGVAAAVQAGAAAKRLTERGFEGWGTQGACLLPLPAPCPPAQHLWLLDSCAVGRLCPLHPCQP